MLPEVCQGITFNREKIKTKRGKGLTQMFMSLRFYLFKTTGFKIYFIHAKVFINCEGLKISFGESWWHLISSLAKKNLILIKLWYEVTIFKTFLNGQLVSLMFYFVSMCISLSLSMTACRVLQLMSTYANLGLLSWVSYRVFFFTGHPKKFKYWNPLWKYLNFLHPDFKLVLPQQIFSKCYTVTP